MVVNDILPQPQKSGSHSPEVTLLMSNFIPYPHFFGVNSSMNSPPNIKRAVMSDNLSEKI